MKVSTPLRGSAAVQRYLRRIGADFTSLFRAAITRQVKGYEKEIGVVRFGRDGRVHVQDRDYEPDEGEAERIQSDILGMILPTCQPLSALPKTGLPDEVATASSEDLFEFWDTSGQLVMVQVRVALSNGDKRYVPWTHWSDGEWRRSEPDGKLPIWGAFDARDSSRIFIHEGAKAARAAARLASSKDHPWRDYLATGAHVGWIGGAHQAHRGDWELIRRLNPDEVIIVPDNDPVGLRAVPEISKNFRCRASYVGWDSAWPHGFDLADAPPKGMFKNGVWTGPEMANMLLPAEWATDLVPPPEGRGRPLAVARESFLDRWMRVEKLKAFCPVDSPLRMLDKENFNAAMRPFSHVSDTAAVFIKYSGPTVSQPTFDPSTEKLLVRVDKEVQVNQYKDIRVRPKAGDTKIFHEFVRYLLPEEGDREAVLRWMASVYSNPGERLSYGILLLSETQGVGKSTLAEMMAHMIGVSQTGFPSDSIIQSDFNGWIVAKRLVVVHEIYAGHSWKAYNRLKSLITDPEVEANIKHQATYTVKNSAHFFCCSNSMEALRIEDTDRRWLVPKVTETIWDRHKYEQMYAWWRSGGLRALAHEWLNKPSDYYIRSSDRAPDSWAKRQLIENSRPPEYHYLKALMEFAEDDEAVSLSEAWLWVKERARNNHLTVARFSNIARSGGFGITRQLRVVGSRMRVLCPPGVNVEEIEAMQGEQVLERLVHPSTLWDRGSTM